MPANGKLRSWAGSGKRVNSRAQCWFAVPWERSGICGPRNKRGWESGIRERTATGLSEEGGDGAAGSLGPQMQLDDALAAGACAAAARDDRGQWPWQMMEAMQKVTRPTVEEYAYEYVLAPTTSGGYQDLKGRLSTLDPKQSVLCSARLSSEHSLLDSQAGPVDGLHTYLIFHGHSPPEPSRPSCLRRTPPITTLDTCRYTSRWDLCIDKPSSSTSALLNPVPVLQTPLLSVRFLFLFSTLVSRPFQHAQHGESRSRHLSSACRRDQLSLWYLVSGNRWPMRQQGANNMTLAPITSQAPAGTSNQTARWVLRLRYRRHHDPRPEWLVASPGHHPSTVLGRHLALPRLPLPQSLILRIGLGRCVVLPARGETSPLSPLSRLVCLALCLPGRSALAQLEPFFGPWSAANTPDPTRQAKFPHPDCLGGSPDRALLSAHLDSNRECMPFLLSHLPSPSPVTGPPVCSSRRIALPQRGTAEERVKKHGQ